MLDRTLHDIPQMPARRTRVATLSDAPESLVLMSGRAGHAARRVGEILRLDPDARGWRLEPLDNFPHFERDMRRCAEHPLWRRPGMELSRAELSVLVPVARMLAATERWTTGAFASIGLPTEEERLHARESNLGHVVGLLDIVDTHYDSLLTLCGSTDAMRALVRLIFGHDLPEFPKGDHSRSEIAKKDPHERMEAAYRKQCEETEAVEMIASRVRGDMLARAVRDPMERYARGKPKMYTMQTAAQGDLLSFLVKFIDLSQGTEHGCERIFPHYARQADETRAHLQRHLDDGVEELRVIGMKIMRLV